MKKTLQIILAVACLFALSSCSLSDTPPLPGSSAGPAGTTAPPDTSATLPTLLELNAATREATPARSEVTVSSQYQKPAVTLTADIVILHAEEDSYSYRVDRLLSVEEALVVGGSVAEVEGHLTLRPDGTVTSASPEVTAELVAELSTLSCRLPNLDPSFFSSYTITEENASPVLHAIAQDASIPLLFDSSAAGITALSMRVAYDADSLFPTACTMIYRSPGGAAVTYTAVYSYQ